MSSHVHAEAFALMQYECKKCHAVELIWNSRDGVTPFGVDCRQCGGEAMHARWSEDKYEPNYTPPLGSRMFVDLTAEAAKEHALFNAKRFWNDPALPASKDGRWLTVEAMAEDLVKGYLTPGAPDLVVVAG